MTIETVKATYDPSTKKIYVKLSGKKIHRSTVYEYGLTYIDLDKIVGVEVIYITVLICTYISLYKSLSMIGHIII